jgi:hypothetical protein
MGTAAKASGSVSSVGRTGKSKSTPLRATQRSSRPKASLTASPSPYHKFFTEILKHKLGNFLDTKKLTDEDVFRALIHSWGFKPNRKNMPEVGTKRYLRDVDDEDTKSIIYTLSGGPVVVFSNTGTFQDWV